jgi:hypothetical protein
MPRTCRCPHCESVCGIPDDAFGKSVACPACKRPFEPRENGVAARPLGRRDPPPLTDPSRDEKESEHRRTRTGRQRGSSGALVLVLMLAGAGTALMLCLAGIGGIVGYLLLAPREANDLRAARAAEMPPAPLPPAWNKPQPDAGPPNALPPNPPPPNAPPPNAPPAPRSPMEAQAEFPSATPSARADELIRNGDFEQGLKGFRTGYRHSPRHVRDDLTFCLARSPSEGHNDASAFSDHTSGSGLMMVVNGGNAVDKVLWGQTVAIRPETEYTFSLWLASWYHTSPAQLEVRINGKVLGQIVAPTRCGEWKAFTATWRSGAEKHAAVEIFNLTRQISGNDFAIDDISLRGPRPDQLEGKD